MDILKNKQLARFASVGVVNTIIDFLIFDMLVFAAGLSPLPANVISVTIAMAISYRLNHGFVFRSNTKRSAANMFRFFVITAFGLYVIQNVIIHILVNDFGSLDNWLATTFEHITGIQNLHNFIEKNFAKAIATIATMVWNYKMYSHFVMVDRKPKTGKQ